MKPTVMLIFYIVNIITLSANEKLPVFFIEQLKSIQETKNVLKAFDMNDTLQREYEIFNQKYEKTISLGLQVEESKAAEDVNLYLLTLRELQVLNDQIINMTKSLIYSRLKQGECKQVNGYRYLNNEILFPSLNMQNQVIELYQSQCKNVKIDWIETMIQNKKRYSNYDKPPGSVKQSIYYKNEMPIFLFINSEPTWDQEKYKKIILLFERYRLKYVVYDVFTSKSNLAQLKQYSPPNTMYYPTTVIGKRAVYGYNTSEIFEALRQEWFGDRPLDILK